MTAYFPARRRLRHNPILNLYRRLERFGNPAVLEELEKYRTEISEIFINPIYCVYDFVTDHIYFTRNYSRAVEIKEESPRTRAIGDIAEALRTMGRIQ